MADSNNKKPIGREIVDRLSGAASALFGSQQIFSPGQAPTPSLTPDQQESLRGRAFDFPVGFNQRYQPRQGEDVTFAQLRALADSCDILRLVIETRKDQMAKLKFSIRPTDPKVEPDEHCIEIQNFFKMPDGESTWDAWLRMLLEDMFVLDAATVYPWMTNGNKPYRFELMDGSTIKRVLDQRGRTPAAPDPAYQQIIKGLPVTNYTMDELVYAPRNKRTHKVYGYSPVEQVLLTINIAVRRSLHQLQYYTEGSTPDLLFQSPAEWSMDQIKEFNEWWQSMLAGNTAQRRKAQFVPNGVSPVNTKEGALTDKIDEWLARVICYAFSVSHSAFVAQVNRATAESAQQQALEEGLYPIMQWVKGVVDTLIWKYFGRHDLEFVWDDQKAVAPELQSQIDDRDIKNGSKTLNQIRAQRGDDPIEGGDLPMVLTASGYVPINAYADQQAAAAENRALQAKALEQQADNPEEPTDGGNKPKEEPPEDEEGTYKRLVRKSVKRLLQPIDREREEVVKNRNTMAQNLGTIFDIMAKSVAEQVAVSKVDDPTDGIDWLVWVEKTYQSVESYLTAVARSGAKEAYMQLAIDNPSAFTLANEQAALWAADQAAALVGMKWVDGEMVPNAGYSILDTTREMIRGDVAQAIEEGWAPNKLADALSENYAFSDSRAEMIARTELAKADVQGSMITYRTSGVVEKKQWLVGDGCCEDCQALNGVEVDLDADFPNEGGDDPPLHPACRCDVIPVMTQEAAVEGDE